MKRYRSAVTAALGASALLVSSLLVTATPAQAVDDGTLVVNVVDQYGQPVVGVVQLTRSDGSPVIPEGGGTVVASAAHTYTLPADGYAIQHLGLWTGIDCAGTAQCGLTGAGGAVTPVVTVTAGAASTYTMHVTVPTITGGTKVGTPLTVQLPPGLVTMQTVYASIPGLPAGGLGTQWVRATKDIAGATESTYVTQPDDAKKALTARLTPTPAMAFLFASVGAPITPLTTNAITMGKFRPVKTTVKVSVPSSFKASELVTMKVKVTAKKGKPAGKVKITIGHYVTKRPLKNGSALVTLPRLSPGTYTITTSYGAAGLYAGSKVKTTVHVHR